MKSNKWAGLSSSIRALTANNGCRQLPSTNGMLIVVLIMQVIFLDVVSTAKTLLALLCKEGYPAIAAAFDEQQADIVMVNLTTSQYGPLLSTGLTTLGKDFKEAFKEAVTLAENSTQVVLIYSKTRGEISEIYAACLKRDKIELVGSHVDKLDWIFKRKEQPLDFYDLAELVNSLTTDDFKNKDLNHND